MPAPPKQSSVPHAGMSAPQVRIGTPAFPPDRSNPVMQPDTEGHDVEPLVLIVDDDVEMRAYVRLCLKPLTTRLLEAEDGLEALEHLRQGGIALVIADVMMPRMSGLELRDALHADPALAHVPLLLVTGEVDLPGPVLKKPFNARLLCEQGEVLL